MPILGGMAYVPGPGTFVVALPCVFGRLDVPKLYLAAALAVNDVEGRYLSGEGTNFAFLSL